MKIGGPSEMVVAAAMKSGGGSAVAEVIGEERVGFRVDRDVINLRQGEDWYRERRYRTLHFVADGNDIHMMRIRLVVLEWPRRGFSRRSAYSTG